MEQTVNVNEAVTPQNQGVTDDVKQDQPAFEELAAQATEQPTADKTDGGELTEMSTGQPAEELPEANVPEETVETAQETPAPIEPELSPEEKIIDTWLQNGKTEVSMNELIEAGFDAEELDPQSNTIGCFKLSRILLVSPFRIEKINKDTEKV